MQPRALCPYGSTTDRAHWHVERLTALSTETGVLNRGIEQEPQRHALAEGRAVFLPGISIGFVKCTPVNEGPIVPRPIGRASPTSGTTRIPVFRTTRTAAQIAAHAPAPTPPIIA